MLADAFHCHRLTPLFQELIDKVHGVAAETVFAILDSLHGLLDEARQLHPVF